MQNASVTGNNGLFMCVRDGAAHHIPTADCAQRECHFLRKAPLLRESDRVRVRQAVFQPGVRLGPHTHPYAHVRVILDEGSLAFAEKGEKDQT